MVYMSELLIVGCGGLGRMVGEVALATGKWSGVRFLDDAVRGDAEAFYYKHLLAHETY